MTLLAPDGSQTLLPNPDFDNSEAVRDEVEIRQSLDATFYTYIKATDLRELQFTFSTMGRGKIVELQQFFAAFGGEKITFTDLYGETFRCIINGNPLSFTTDNRSFNGGGGRKESGSVTLTLIGTLL